MSPRKLVRIKHKLVFVLICLLRCEILRFHDKYRYQIQQIRTDNLSNITGSSLVRKTRYSTLSKQIKILAYKSMQIFKKKKS